MRTQRRVAAIAVASVFTSAAPALAALASAALALAALAGCGRGAGGNTAVAPIAVAHTAAGHSAAGHSAAGHSAAGSRPASYLTGLMAVLGPATAIVGLDVPSGIGTSAHFAITSDAGRTFRPFGPVQTNQDLPDSAFFLTRADGWLATFAGGGGGEFVYRTNDDGRRWRESAGAVHVLAAGSTDLLQFTSPRSGWLADIQPTGPIEMLLHSTNGGRTWHCVSATHQEGACPGTLPGLGPVAFEPGGRTGWLGGGQFSTALYRTSDGGRTWQAMPVPAPRDAIFGLPAIFGRTVVETVTAGHGPRYRSRSPALTAARNGGWPRSCTAPATGPAAPRRSPRASRRCRPGGPLRSAAAGWRFITVPGQPARGAGCPSWSVKLAAAIPARHR
jgi:Photosynthesis system II assembly factor YCF48